MNKTVYLHIGAPKTGSTSIQAWFCKNKLEIQNNDILYPGEIKRHNFILSMCHPEPQSLRMNHFFGRNFSKKDILNAELEKIDNEIRDTKARNILFSNENFFSMARILDLRKLKNYLNKYSDEVKIIAYFRDPLKQLLSRCQEQIKSGVFTYEKVIEKPPIIDNKLINYYIEIFGLKNMIFLNFDTAVSNNKLFEHLTKSINPNLKVYDFNEIEAKNKALSFEAILLISELNREYGYKKNWKSRFIKFNTFEDIGKTKFSLPKESLDQVRDRIEEQYLFLNSLGFNFKMPDWNNLVITEPKWSFETINETFELIKKMSEAISKKDIKEAKKYVRQELL